MPTAHTEMGAENNKRTIGELRFRPVRQRMEERGREGREKGRVKFNNERHAKNYGR